MFICLVFCRNVKLPLLTLWCGTLCIILVLVLAKHFQDITNMNCPQCDLQDLPDLLAERERKRDTYSYKYTHINMHIHIPAEREREREVNQ